jgi:hypothetical protein
MQNHRTVYETIQTLLVNSAQQQHEAITKYDSAKYTCGNFMISFVSLIPFALCRSDQKITVTLFYFLILTNPLFDSLLLIVRLKILCGNDSVTSLDPY